MIGDSSYIPIYRSSQSIKACIWSSTSMNDTFEIRSVWSTKKRSLSTQWGPNPPDPLGRFAPKSPSVHKNRRCGARNPRNRPSEHENGPYGARYASRFEIMRQNNYLYIDLSEFVELNQFLQIFYSFLRTILSNGCRFDK
jgi:hypothetical protein